MSSSSDFYKSRKMLTVLLLGFSSGLPLAMTGGTLQAWLTDEHIDVKIIGALSLVGLPYSYKFLWSPLMDRYFPPLMSASLGRRRSWIFLTQILLALTMAALAASSPSTSPYFFGILAVTLAFFSASQDIVIDAYRTELLDDSERGPGAGVSILGYRVAMLTSGALALILSDHLPWRSVYLLLATLMAALSVVTWFAPETSGNIRPPRTLKAAIVDPLKDFWSRSHAGEILAFIILYKLGDVMAVALTTKFMLDLGFTKSDIGYVAKGLGLACSIGGSLLGGEFVAKRGLLLSLFVFGILQGGSILAFALLAVVGKDFTVMSLAIGLENFCNGLGNAALVTFLMGLCNKSYTATQYSLLTSAQSLSRTLAASITGYLVAWYGWTHFFLICTALAAPGLLLLLRFPKWMEIKNSHEAKNPA